MSITKAQAQALAARGYENPVWFCEFFLSKWFPTPMPWLHRGVLAILLRKADFLRDDPELGKIIDNFVYYAPDDLEKKNPQHIFSLEEDGSVSMTLGKFTLLLMPRGIAKTTLLNATNLFVILYQDCHFPFYTSKTGKHASRQLSSITRQLTSNSRVKAVFGELKPPQRNEGSLKWSESDGFIQTITGISMAASGRGGQVRGMLDDGQRPDRLYIDDLEDQEATKTDDRRDDTKDWFFSDLLPVLPEQDSAATATMLSNLVHAECLATAIAQDPQWTVVKFGLRDKDGEPVWPLLFDERKIDLKKQSYALQGKLHRFYMEYFNEVRAPERAKFKKEFFIHVPSPPKELMALSIAIDPAISEKREADYCVTTVTGMRKDGRIAVLDQYGAIGMTPREQVDKYFELVAKHNLALRPNSRYGIESISYQAALVHLMQEEMFRRKVYFEIDKLGHTQKKEERIEGILQPRYANGYIVHSRVFPELETSLLDWPNGKKDWADSLAMAVSLLDDASPFAAEGDLAEDSAESLEKLFGGDWRSY